MKPDSNILTIAELEALCQAYLDCRLSRLQEKELELVLTAEDASTPVIDEAREVMGITTLLESAKHVKTRQSPLRRRSVIWGAAAVCLALAIGFGVRFINREVSGTNTPENSEYIVIIDGEYLSPEQAKKVALETQHMCMADFENTVHQAQELQRQSISTMNKKQLIQ
ncbi:MAG: hypothetical protein K2K97_01290 [Muribaculaceae bacterium]|nr:hypothetical protein [Muribaculaceae bacterium]